MIGIIGILATIALTLYLRQPPRARIAKAQADTRAIAAGLVTYMSHCGALPPSGAEAAGGFCNGSGLAALTVPQTNGSGHTSGPFLASVPNPPGSWTAYTAGYVADFYGAGTFRIMTRGDGVVVTYP